VTRNGLNLDSLGVGIAMSILSPHSNAARNSIFGWIPAELVGDQNAHEFYHGKIDEAVHKALQKDLETNVRVHNKAKYRKHESALLGEWSVKELNSAYFFANDDLGCPETESAVTKEDWLKRCLIGFSSFRDPDRESINASEELQSHSIPFKNVHAFTAETGYTYTRLYFNRPETSRLNELELIQAISNRLPDFMFIYAAPKKVTVANDEKLQFPILFRSGKPMFFVASESE